MPECFCQGIGIYTIWIKKYKYRIIDHVQIYNLIICVILLYYVDILHIFRHFNKRYSIWTEFVPQVM